MNDFLIFTRFREEENYYNALSLSYSYSYVYSHKAENENDISATNENESQATLLPESDPKNNTDDETTSLISTQVVSVDSNNTETISSLNDQNSTDNTAMVFPGIKAEIAESTSAESISSLAKSIIGLGIGCTAVVALIALSKRRAQLFTTSD